MAIPLTYDSIYYNIIDIVWRIKVKGFYKSEFIPGYSTNNI